MLNDQKIHTVEDIDFTVVYSRRRSLGISVRPDSSVIIRVPYLTSLKTINRIVHQKATWIRKHRDNYLKKKPEKLNRLYINGETHLFRGYELQLIIAESERPYVKFNISTIEIGAGMLNNQEIIKKLLYKGYKNEAGVVFPELMNGVLEKHKNQMFKPAGLVIRTMKRRWGSCSNKGIITLSTELIKLPDLFIEYVILHELCHLKHHNHGAGYYKLLSELFPEWKIIRKGLKNYIQ